MRTLNIRRSFDRRVDCFWFFYIIMATGLEMEELMFWVALGECTAWNKGCKAFRFVRFA